MGKKFLAFVLCISIIFVFTADIYANNSAFSLFESIYKTSDDNLILLDNFEITSGINKDTETTFDNSRTFSGSALKDTFVKIKVFEYSEKTEEFTDVYNDSFTVGPSGIFSKSIDLKLGKNYILITAEKDGKSAVYTALINRKDEEIKKEIEKGIILPTNNSIYSK